MSEHNKEIVRRLVDEVMNAGRLDVLDVLDEIYTPSMAVAAKAWITLFRASFPRSASSGWGHTRRSLSASIVRAT